MKWLLGTRKLRTILNHQPAVQRGFNNRLGNNTVLILLLLTIFVFYRLSRKMEKWSSTLLGKQWQQSQQDWQVLVHLMELNQKLVSWWLQPAALTIYAEWTLHGILGCNHCSIYLLSHLFYVQSVHYPLYPILCHFMYKVYSFKLQMFM